MKLVGDSKFIAEAYGNVMSVGAMKKVAANTEYFDFVNSFPGIEKQTDPRIVYTFNVLAANLARQEKLMNNVKQHTAKAMEAKALLEQ